MDTRSRPDLPTAALEVRSILAELGWTHAVAADYLGVGRVSVSRWGSGSRDPGEQVLRHLRMLMHLRVRVGDDLWSETMDDLSEACSHAWSTT